MFDSFILRLCRVGSIGTAHKRRYILSKIENLTNEQLLEYYKKSNSQRQFAKLCGYKNRIRIKENSEQYIRFTNLGIVFPKENNHIRHKKNCCIKCGKPIWDTNKSGYCQTCKKEMEDQEKINLWLKTGNTQCSVKTTLRNCIRKYILDSQNGKCAICGMPQVWNNKHLNFILDHIDGNASNNNKNNLRLICPNCDSQLDTYKSKNHNSARSYRNTK